MVAPCRDGFGLTTAPVASFAANEVGLNDMIGNVWEWTADCFAPNYVSVPSNGNPVNAADCEHRIVRGGAWAMNDDGWRRADRDRDGADRRYSVVGIRMVREID